MYDVLLMEDNFYMNFFVIFFLMDKGENEGIVFEIMVFVDIYFVEDFILVSIVNRDFILYFLFKLI